MHFIHHVLYLLLQALGCFLNDGPAFECILLDVEHLGANVLENVVVVPVLLSVLVVGADDCPSAELDFAGE